MNTQKIPDDAPASALFPEFETLYDLIAPEVEGLTDEQLDWTSDGMGVGALEHTPADQSHGVPAVPLARSALGGHALPRRRARRRGCRRRRGVGERPRARRALP